MSTSSLLLLLLSLCGSCFCCCPESWTQFGSSCYIYVRSDLSWVEANLVSASVVMLVVLAQVSVSTRLSRGCSKSVCKQLGGHLVEINSAEENDFVMSLLSINEASDAWIGIDDIATDGEWVLSSSRRPMGYINWDSDEPNNHEGKKEDCGSIKSNGFWNDAFCNSSRQYPSVCQRSAYS